MSLGLTHSVSVVLVLQCVLVLLKSWSHPLGVCGLGFAMCFGLAEVRESLWNPISHGESKLLA